MLLAVPVCIGIATVLVAPARDGRFALHYGLAAMAAYRLVTEGPMHAGKRCNSGRAKTLLRRPKRLSLETLKYFLLFCSSTPVF